ncbi:hypothetical protein C0J52_05371, partial [Blattella germanica]
LFSYNIQFNRKIPLLKFIKKIVYIISRKCTLLCIVLIYCENKQPILEYAWDVTSQDNLYSMLNEQSGVAVSTKVNIRQK